MESLLGESEVSSLETRVPVPLKFLQEFPEAVFLVEDVESLLGESEVSSLESRVPVRKGHNF